MVSVPIATPPTHPDKGGGQGGRKRPRGGGQARYYAFLGRTEAVVSDVIITIIVSVFHRDVSVLFDPGSAYSYMSSYFASYLDMSRDSLSTLVYVSAPVRDSIVVDRVHCSFLVTIGGYETRVDLLQYNMVHFDMILDMDWLSPYHAILDCHAKIVTSN
ncbi:uncharacterized protein [Nicotiana tomentosiformis]|uniref:uncharacterized protein n=1 Tax=Nicotiana tomentosiformis TaxID=4098 RepID=UPI00388C726A